MNCFLACEYSERVGGISLPPSLFDTPLAFAAFGASLLSFFSDLALAFALAAVASRFDAASKRCACGVMGFTSLDFKMSSTSSSESKCLDVVSQMGTSMV